MKITNWFNSLTSKKDEEMSVRPLTLGEEFDICSRALIKRELLFSEVPEKLQSLFSERDTLCFKFLEKPFELKDVSVADKSAIVLFIHNYFPGGDYWKLLPVSVREDILFFVKYWATGVISIKSVSPETATKEFKENALLAAYQLNKNALDFLFDDLELSKEDRYKFIDMIWPDLCKRDSNLIELISIEEVEWWFEKAKTSAKYIQRFPLSVRSDPFFIYKVLDGEVLTYSELKNYVDGLSYHVFIREMDEAGIPLKQGLLKLCEQSMLRSKHREILDTDSNKEKILDAL